MDVLRALRIIKDKKLLFLLGTALAMVALGLTGQQSEAPPLYAATAKVLLTPPSVTVAGEAAQAGASLRTWFADPTLLKELLKSSELVDRVAGRLGLKDGRGLRDRVALEPISQANGNVTLATIAVTAESPKESQRQTAAFVEEFINYVEELSAREQASTRQYLEELVAEAQARIAEAENGILSWQDKHKAPSVDQALAELASREGEMEAESARLKQEVAGLERELGQLREFKQGRSTTAPWAILSQERQALGALEDNVAAQKLKLAELRQTFTDESLQVREQADRLKTATELYQVDLAAVVTSYLEEKEAALARSRASLAALGGALASLRKKMQVGDERFRLARLQRDLAKWEETYSQLTQQLYRARVLEQGSRRRGAISMLEAPAPGTILGKAVRPSSLKRFLLGLPFCFIFGVTLVLVVDAMSSSMKMRPRVEETLDLPVLGAIPRIPSELAQHWEEVKKTSLRERGGPRVLVGAGSSSVRNGSGHVNGNGYRNGSGSTNGKGAPRA